MISEEDFVPREKRDWADWLSAHAWWTALLAGGILCGVAIVLS